MLTRFKARPRSCNLAVAGEINRIVTDSTSNCGVLTLHPPSNVEQHR